MLLAILLLRMSPPAVRRHRWLAAFWSNQLPLSVVVATEVLLGMLDLMSAVARTNDGFYK